MQSNLWKWREMNVFSLHSAAEGKYSRQAPCCRLHTSNAVGKGDSSVFVAGCQSRAITEQAPIPEPRVRSLGMEWKRHRYIDQPPASSQDYKGCKYHTSENLNNMHKYFLIREEFISKVTYPVLRWSQTQVKYFVNSVKTSESWQWLSVWSTVCAPSHRHFLPQDSLPCSSSLNMKIHKDWRHLRKGTFKSEVLKILNFNLFLSRLEQNGCPLSWG